MDPSFTVEKGLELQAKNLAEWKKKLRPAFFAEVKKQVERENKWLAPDATGYDVTRGNAISNIVHNL